MELAELEAEKKRLIETLGVYFEKEKQVAPLAARILATLIMNGECGTTFDQLVSELDASKSTIFTHLSNLETQEWITHFTKPGDRKRYYVMNPGYISHRINVLISQWQKEIDLRKQIMAYKKDFNRLMPEKANNNASHENVLNFLIRSVEYFQKQTEEYNSNNKKNNIEEL